MVKKSTDRNHVRKHTIEQMLGYIDLYDKARHRAKNDYISLVDRYPSSTALLRQYASFCDVVMNSVQKAEKLRKHAQSMENNVEAEEDDDEAQMELEMDAANSAGTSEQHENGRMSSVRFFQNNRSSILKKDIHRVVTMDLIVKQTLLGLVVLGTVTFCITDLFLFKDTAMKNLRLIDGTGLFTVYTVRACFYIRDQLVSAGYGDDDKVGLFKDKIQDYAMRLQRQHFLNYQDIPDALDYFYHAKPIIHVDPIDKAWKQYTHSFWYLGNEFVYRMGAASSTTPDEFRDPTYKIDQISPEKRNVAYIFQNSFRYMIPS